MYDYITFLLNYNLDERDMEKIKEFNETLKNLGVSIAFKESTDEKKYTYRYITIKYDTEKIEEKQKRGAGAPFKIANRIMKVEEVRERMKSESAESIAKELGISRATLFRRLKQAEKYDDDYV